MLTCFSIVLTGKLPFHHVMMHGVVCDSQGKKMSKSKGNVVDPLHVINGRSLKELEEDLKLTGHALMNEKEIFDHHVDCEFEFYSEGMSEFFTSSVLAVENNSDLSPGSLIFIQEPSLKSYMNGFYMEVRRSDKIRNLNTTTV